MIGVEHVRAPILEEDPPLLLLAWREAKALETAWRLHYRMPPTDPRYREADSDTILKDLLVLRYHGHLRDLALHPERASEEEARSETVRDEMTAFRDALVARPGWLAAQYRAIRAAQAESTHTRPPTPGDEATEAPPITALTLGGPHE